MKRTFSLDYFGRNTYHGREWKQGGFMQFNGFTDESIAFMLDIRFHNSKEFMQKHRADYIKKLRDPYYQLIEGLKETMLAIDPQMEVRPVKVLSRIFRDTRFSKDKSPYRDHHWIAFRRQGLPRIAAPMFWAEVRIERVSWGLGFWGENKDAMDLLRSQMLENPKPFIELLKTASDQGFLLEGNDYKRMAVPPELSKDLGELYIKKELLFIKTPGDGSLIFSNAFEKKLKEDFTVLAPIYHMMLNSYNLTQTGGIQRGLPKT